MGLAIAPGFAQRPRMPLGFSASASAVTLRLLAFLAILPCLPFSPTAAAATTETTAATATATAAATPFAIIDSPVRSVAPDGWRITWTSVAGQAYRLERSPDLSTWTEVASLVAEGPTSTVLDTFQPAVVPRRFWRVVEISAAGDAIAPVVSGFTASVVSINGQPTLQLRAAASDNVGVVGLLFLEGATTLGAGAFDPATAFWQLTQPAPSDPFAVRQLKARARDAANNTGDSPPLAFTLFDPARFSALAADGSSLRGAAVPIDGAGRLGPFAYRLGGGGALGSGADLALHFPAGATLLTENGQQFIEFTSATLVAGPDSPFQLNAPLASANATPRRLRLQPPDTLTVAQLETVLGRAAGSGLPLRLFDRFELTLVAGSLGAEGLLAPVFAPVGENLPALPALSTAIAGLRVDFSDPDQLRLPFSGEWTLPDASATPARLRVPAANPLWLTLRRDGSVALDGRAELLLRPTVEAAPTLRLRVDVRLDDPIYHLQISTDAVEVPLIDTLADLLPSPPASVNLSALDAETARLTALARAYRNFSAAAAAAAPIPTDDAALAAPVAAAPDDATTLGSLLDAWGESARATALGTLGGSTLAALQDFAAQLARAGASASDLDSVLRYRLAAARARAALGQGALNPALDAALTDLEAAALARASAPTALATLADLRATLATLVETRAFYQLIGRPEPASLDAACLRALDTFLADLCRGSGVVAGQFTPPAGSPVAALGRFAAYQRLRDLLDVFASAQLLGYQADANDFSGFAAPVAELVAQLGVRAATVLHADLAAAESAADYRAALFATEELLFLAAGRQLGLFPDLPAATAALDSAGLGASLVNTLGPRLALVFAADLAKPVEERSWNDLAGEVRRLAAILGQVDAAGSAPTIPPEPFVNAFNRREAALALATSETALAAESRPGVLVRLIEAGSLHARLARRFAGQPFLVSGEAWENGRLPRIRARLQTLAAATGAWGDLHDAARHLLGEADQLRLEAARPGAPVADLATARARVLNQSAELLTTTRAVAQALWAGIEPRRAGAGLAAFDAVLPGNLTVRRPFGALTWNRATGFLRGTLGGQLELPGLFGGTRLEVLRASITNRGAFDLSVAGAIENLALGELTGVLSVPARRPLHIAHRPGQPLAIAGSVHLALSNGIFFEGYLDFADPLYRFGAAAGGVRFDLADRLLVSLPPSVNFSSVPAQLLPVWNAYLRDLGATLEPLAALAEPLETGTPGTPPEFTDPAFTFQYSDLGAWAGGVAVDAALTGGDSLRAFLGFANEHLASAATAASGASGYLERQRLLARLADAINQTRRVLDEQSASQLQDIAVADPEFRPRLDAIEAEVGAFLADPLSSATPDAATLALRLAAAVSAMRQELGLDDNLLGSPAYTQVLAAGLGSRLTELGLAPATGLVVDNARFNALSREAVLQALIELADQQARMETVGGDLGEPYANATAALAARLRNLTVAALAAAPNEDWPERTRLARDMLFLTDPGTISGFGDASFENLLRQDLENLILVAEDIAVVQARDLRARAHDPFYRFVSDLHRALRSLGGTPRPLASVATELAKREIKDELHALGPFLDVVAGAPIPDAGRGLRSLIEINEAAIDLLPPGDPIALSARTRLQTFTATLPGVALTQRAWWELSEHTRLLAEAFARRSALADATLAPVLRTALDTSLSSALALANALKPRVTANSPLDLRLPGDVVVRRASGDFLFDRSIPRFTATFGGRLEFPEVDATFTVRAATIDSDGAWSIDLAATDELNAGGDDLRYQVTSFRLAGDALGALQNGSGAGSLFVSQPGEPAASADRYDATFFFGTRGGETERVFEVSTGASGRFVFDPDFVVFDAALSLRFTTGARSGRLGTTGTVGLFKRHDYDEATVTPADFQVGLVDTGLAFAYRPDGYDVELSGGTVRLPVFETVVGSVACATPSALAARPGQHQAPSVTLGTGLRLSFDDDAGFRFSTLADAPVALTFQNFGLTLPEFPALRLDICTATLRLPVVAGEPPVLDEFSAKLELPLPPRAGVARSVVTRISAAQWGTDGLPPESVTIGLANDVELLPVAEGGFGVTLLGAGCGGPDPQPSGLTLARESDATRDTLRIELSGGLRVAVANDVLFDEVNARPFSLAGCGGLTQRFDRDRASGVVTARVPEFTPGPITAAGFFRLGGADGLTVDLAALTVAGLENAFDPTPALPLSITLTGEVGLGTLGSFGLGDTRFLFEGAALPRFVPGSFTFAPGTALPFAGIEELPVTLTRLSFGFTEGGRPLETLFAPDNLFVVVSGGVRLEIPGGGDDVPAPRIAGSVTDLAIRFPEGLSGPPVFTANGLSLVLEDFGVGDLGGISGGLTVSNLQNPSDAVFSGVLGATYNGVGLKVFAAFTTRGPLGLCIDANAGPAGIPLDGGVLGGILLTGAQGGVSFGNTFADPCDFRSDPRLTAPNTPATPPPAALAVSSALRGAATSSSPNLAAPPGDGDVAAPSNLRFGTLTSVVKLHPSKASGSTATGISWSEWAVRQRAHEAAVRTRTSVGRIGATVNGVPIASSFVAPPAASLAATSADPLPPSASFASASGSTPTPAPAAATSTATAPDLDSRCPTGDCPPSTLNLLAQRHPSLAEEPGEGNYQRAYAERVIFKFSSLSREQVDEILGLIGLSPSNLQGTPAELAEDFAFMARVTLDERIPRVCTTGPSIDCPMPAAEAAALNAAIADGLAGFETHLRNALEQGLSAAIGDERPLIDALYEAAYAGVPSLDLTLQLKGTFSHAAISTTLTVTGGAVASTTGTAGIQGSLNLLGVPVGAADLFVSYTDSAGNPNPSFCGDALAALGPLEFGQLKFVLRCDGCVTGILAALGNFVGNLTGDTLAQVQPVVLQFIDDANGSAPVDSSRPLTDYIGPGPVGGVRLTEQQQFAVVGQLFNIPQLAATLADPPAGFVAPFSPAAIEALNQNITTLIIESYLSVQPVLSFCGGVQPKLFGFPLAPESVGANLFVGRIEDAGVNYDEIAAQIRFSPSWVMLNYGLVLGTAGQFPPVIPGFDEADLGFSTRARSFDATSFRAFLDDPVAGSVERAGEVLENTLITFGYKLNPFGLELADGQGRLILPQFDHHPQNPARVGGEWTPPAAPDFASRKELLMAAAAADRLNDPTWRGLAGQLGELFPDAPAPFVARMDTLDLTRDYFPHGGLLGAAALRLPKPITDAPPASVFALLDPTRTLEQRFADLQTSWDTYFSQTSEVGRLTLYFPAPNPVGLWAPGLVPSASDFDRAMRSNDFATVLANARDAEFYAFDQVFLSGNFNASLLGLPLAEAAVELDGQRGLLLITAGLPPEDNWLKRLVGAEASLRFEVAPPRQTAAQIGASPLRGYADSTAPTLAELFAAAGEAAGPAALEAALDDFVAGLPRVSLEAEVGLALPAHLSNVLRVTEGGGASAMLFGYSPAFDPGFTPLDDPLFRPEAPDPQTLARRNGGVGVRGRFEVGLLGADPAGSVSFVGEGAFSFFQPGGGVDLPALAGTMRFTSGGMPGYTFPAGFLAFNSAPEIGENFVLADVTLPEIDLGSFLQITSHDGGALGGRLSVARLAADAVGTSVRIEPARAAMPFLGSVVVDVFGEDPGEPFTFSTVPGQAWTASLLISGALEVRDPLDLSGAVLFKIEPAGDLPFAASAKGVGLDEFSLRITLPNGATITTYPGQTNESRFTLGSANVSCLLVERLPNGSARIYYDSGTRTLPLFPATPGDASSALLSVTGRVEFGFEPVGFSGALEVAATPVAFGTVALGSSATQNVTVKNVGFGRLMLDPELLGGGAHYSVTPTSLALEPGESRSLVLRFTPQAGGSLPATLRLAHDGANATATLAVSGVGGASPRLHLSTTAVEFGTQPAGRAADQFVLVTNPGHADLVVSAASVTASTPFGVSPASATIPAGASRRFTARFLGSTSTTRQTSTLTFTSNAGTQTVSLGANASARFWYQQRRDLRSVRAVALTGVNTGWAAGDGGEFLRMDNGRTWASLPHPAPADWRALAFSENAARGWLAGRASEGFLTTDGGETWRPFDGIKPKDGSPATIDLTALARYSADRVVVAGVNTDGAGLRSPRLFKELADGSQFNALSTSGITGPDILGLSFLYRINGALQFENTTPAIAVGSDRRVFRSTNGGSTWAATSVPASVAATSDLFAVAFNGVETVVVVGENRTLLLSTNLGVSYTAVTAPGVGSTTTLRAVTFVSATQAFVVGDRGVIVRGTRSGSTWTWTSESADSAADFFAVAANGTQPWIGGEVGEIHTRSTTALTTGLIAVSESAVDFRDIQSGEIRFRTIRARNSGRAPLTVSASLTGAAAFSLVGETFVTLAPEQETSLTVRCAPTTNNATVAGTLTLATTEAIDGLPSLEIPLGATSASPAWKRLPPPALDDFVAVRALSASTWLLASTNSTYLTTNNGDSWTTATPFSPIRAVALHGSKVAMLGGGDGTGANATLLARSTGTGAAWTALPPVTNQTTHPVVDFHLLDPGTGLEGLAVTTLSGTGTTGSVLLGTANAATWTALAPPVSGFAGRAVFRSRVDRLFAADATRLFLSARTPVAWSEILDAGAINDLFFSNENVGYLVGAGGNLWRTTTGGTTKASWTKLTPSGFTTADDLRQIEFSSTATGYLLAESASATSVFRSTNAGSTWSASLALPKDDFTPELRGLVAIPSASTLALAVGTRGGLYRLQTIPARAAGFLLPERPTWEFAPVEAGRQSDEFLLLTNPGNAALTVSAADLHDGDTAVFHAELSAPLVIPAGGSAELPLRFTPEKAGLYRARLRLSSDADNSAVDIVLVGQVARAQRVVLLDTVPTGRVLSVTDVTSSPANAGFTVTTPAAFRVTDGTTSNPTVEWAASDTRTIKLVEPEFTANDVTYRFRHWDRDSAGETLEIKPENETVVRRVAEFARTLPTPPAFVAPPVVPANPCLDAAPPSGVPAGPWIKISQAYVDVPALGADGRAILAEGSILLGFGKLDAALRTSAIHVATGDGLRVLDITAGSWRLRQDGTLVNFGARQPGVQVFRRDLLPPSDLAVVIDAHPLSRVVKGSFSADGTLPLMPGLVELGAAGSTPARIEAALSPALGFAVSGQLRMLRLPEGDFAYRSAADAAQPIFSLGNANPAPAGEFTLAEFGFSRVKATTDTTITLRQNPSTGVFTLDVAKLALEGFGASGTLDTSIATDGLFTATRDPAGDFHDFGFLRLKILDSVPAASRPITISANALRGAYSLRLPPGRVMPPAGANWWSEQSAFELGSGLTFDTTADFEQRFDLPALTFAGLELDGGSGDENYLALFRRAGVLGVKLKATRDLDFGIARGDFSLSLSARTNVLQGAASGVVEIPFVDDIDVTLNYDSADSSFPFDATRRVGGIRYRLEYGPAGVRITQP